MKKTVGIGEIPTVFLYLNFPTNTKQEFAEQQATEILKSFPGRSLQREPV
jgi:hypothetical protein